MSKTLFGEGLFGEDLYSGFVQEGKWTNSYTFDYIEGTTVFVTVEGLANIPFGTQVEILAGPTQENLTQLTGNREALDYSGVPTGDANLFVEVRLKRNSIYIDGLKVQELSFFVEQEASLYTIALDVLRDGSFLFGSDWDVDPRLQDIIIPYSFITPQPHYDALKLISDSCGAYIYQGRDGRIKLTLPQSMGSNGSAYVIPKNKTYDIANRDNEVFNRIIINVKPLVALDEQEVWALTGGDIIFLDEIIEYEARVSEWDAVADLSARINSTGTNPATIEEVEYFSWGARIKVKGGEDLQTIGLFLDGKPLVVEGKNVIDIKDDNSIRTNGERALTIDDNVLLQVPEVARALANELLSENKSARRDFSVTWRGYPALETGDMVDASGVVGVIVGSDIDFNGFLKVRNEIRRRV